MFVLSHQTNPVSMVLGNFSPFIALTAASTHLYPMPTGSWLMAPATSSGFDCFLQLLAGIVADHHDLAFFAGFLDAVHHALHRTFIGAEVPLQVRVGLDDGLGDVSGLERVTAPYWVLTIVMFGYFALI